MSLRVTNSYLYSVYDLVKPQKNLSFQTPKFGKIFKKLDTVHKVSPKKIQENISRVENTDYLLLWGWELSPFQRFLTKKKPLKNVTSNVYKLYMFVHIKFSEKSIFISIMSNYNLHSENKFSSNRLSTLHPRGLHSRVYTNLSQCLFCDKIKMNRSLAGIFFVTNL